MIRLDPGVSGLAAFLAVLLTIGLLSKIGGNGADLAIMTALCGILGMLAPGLVPSRGSDPRKPATPPADAAAGGQAVADQAQEAADDIKRV